MIKKDDVLKCIITGFKDYGIFVKLAEGYDGLIHISEISESFVKNITDYGDIGEEIYAKVIDVDHELKHVKLTIKNINYKVDGKDIDDEDLNGFLPLKKHLNVWINEKIKEIRK